MKAPLIMSDTETQNTKPKVNRERLIEVVIIAAVTTVANQIANGWFTLPAIQEKIQTIVHNDTQQTARIQALEAGRERYQYEITEATNAIRDLAKEQREFNRSLSDRVTRLEAKGR
jgi:hypothetical protein